MGNFLSNLFGAPGAALSDLNKLGATFGAFFTDVTDVHMWASLGWLALGFFMLVFGILLWLRVPQKVAQVGTSVGSAAIAGAL